MCSAPILHGKGTIDICEITQGNINDKSSREIYLSFMSKYTIAEVINEKQNNRYKRL